jgi:hypothetical protein
MPSTNFFFLGYIVDSKLQLQIDNCESSELGFLEDSSYLEKIVVDDIEYIGRRLGEISTVSSVEDSARNVASLILRVAPGWSGKSVDALLISVQETITPS